MEKKFIYNLNNFIIGLNIINKYINQDDFPFILSGYDITFNINKKNINKITKEEKEELEKLGFIIVENTIYTYQYTN